MRARAAQRPRRVHRRTPASLHLMMPHPVQISVLAAVSSLTSALASASFAQQFGSLFATSIKNRPYAARTSGSSALSSASATSRPPSKPENCCDGREICGDVRFEQDREQERREALRPGLRVRPVPCRSLGRLRLTRRRGLSVWGAWADARRITQRRKPGSRYLKRESVPTGQGSTFSAFRAWATRHLQFHFTHRSRGALILLFRFLAGMERVERG